jgi:hypothetical protein
VGQPRQLGRRHTADNEDYVYVYRARLVQGRTPYVYGGTVRALTLDMSRTLQDPTPTISRKPLGIGGEGLGVEDELHWTHGYIEANLHLKADTLVRIDTPAIPIAGSESLNLQELELQILKKVPAEQLYKPLTETGLQI